MVRLGGWISLVTGLVVMTSTAKPAEPAEPIRYTLRFPAPHTHYVEVEARVPVRGSADVEMMMAVWTPGSYLVREYARHLEEISAAGPDGAALEISKVRKNRWKIKTGGAGEITVAYRIYCADDVRAGKLGRSLVRAAQWRRDLPDACRPGTSTSRRFPRAPSRLAYQHDRAARGARPAAAPLPGARFRHAGGFAHLRGQPVDLRIPGRRGAPFPGQRGGGIALGRPAVRPRRRGDRPGAEGVLGRLALWKIHLLQRAGRGRRGPGTQELHGLDGQPVGHANPVELSRPGSTWSATSSSTPGTSSGCVPLELGPFDYENEVYTTNLWVAEGITSYYDRLLVRRAGLCTVEEYLAGDPPSPGSDSDRSVNDIERLQTTPGRLVQPLELSSTDAWIKLYRRDENTPNTGISYYVKGAVVAFLLDARIRRATHGKKSLDDVMRLAYGRYSGAQGFTAMQFRALAQEVAGIDLAAWFRRVLETTEELDYAEALDWFGLRFTKEEKKNHAAGKAPRAWLGLVTKNEDGRLIVNQVKRGTPGYDAGFNVGDEILAIGDDRVPADQWSRRMEYFSPGEKVSILISRRDRLQRLDAAFGQEPPRQWGLEANPDATEAQKARRKAWIGG